MPVPKEKARVERQAMPHQDAAARVTNFSEVALGFSEELALLEASRCLDCKKPTCMDGCPVEIEIPEFIKHIKAHDYQMAIDTIKRKNNLPAICGRVCPQENQCEKYCVLGKKFEPVAIGRLERFAADWEMNQPEKAEKDLPGKSGKKVAVVGAGPAGLTAAADLAILGHEVVVFEALHTPGGVLVYGIPEFRLPKAIVEREIKGIKQLGVEIKTNMVVGAINTIDELLASGFDAVFIGTGAGLPYFMEIPGENLNGVYSANEFLTRTNLMKGYLFPEYLTPIRIGKRVAVIGAGNVAMDSARTALRLGAEESYIVYRRSEKEMPARQEEIEHAREEGVQFRLLTSPVEIIGDENGWVKSLICQKFELGEPDASGRRRPVAIHGSEYEMEMDTVVMAIGQGPNPLVPRTTPDLQLNRNGNIVADEASGQTSKKAVFAGGDIVTGAATVIQAMGAGKKAAKAIHEYLKGL
ncbi:MAG TPA: NADPH-dependent glutamate synthase [Syntrophomonadaceae bacterium]|nr:NADPH-dependent glutamate synthase [Syntrophomonadaceae bacterium]